MAESSRRRRIAGESRPGVAAPSDDTPVDDAVEQPVEPEAVEEPAVASRAPLPRPARPVPRRRQAPATEEPAEAPTPVEPVELEQQQVDDGDDSTDDTTGRSDEDPARPSLVSRLRWSLVAAALVLVAGIGVGAWGVTSAAGGGDVDQRAATAAGNAAETIFSYRYDALDEHEKASKALMTPSYQKEFDKVEPALTALAPQRKVQVEAVARDAAPVACGEDCSDDTVTVLVFLDLARLTGDSSEPTVLANRVSVTMQRDGDDWLVDDVRAL